MRSGVACVEEAAWTIACVDSQTSLESTSRSDMMHRGMSIDAVAIKTGLTGEIGETGADRPKLVVPGSVLSVCQVRWLLAC